MLSPVQNFFTRHIGSAASTEALDAALYRTGRLFPEIQTQWVVITGPPSAGKTTAATFFDRLGIPISAEAAAQLITEALDAGFTRDQIYSREASHARQHAILARGLENELRQDPDKFLLLDRSWIDAIPFSAELGVKCSQFMPRVGLLRYQAVLYLEALPLSGDSYRPDDAEFDALRMRVDERSREFWQSLGYSPIVIPALDPQGRVLSIPERLALVGRALGFDRYVELLQQLHHQAFEIVGENQVPSPLTELARASQRNRSQSIRSD